MATRREKRAASILSCGVPAVLPIPGADAMVVVDFTVMDVSNKSLINDGFDGGELRNETEL